MRALVRMVAEEPDPDMRNVLTALNAAANDFVQMQALSGEAHKQAVTTIVDGIETADSLDKKGAGGIERCGRPGKAIEGVRPTYYRCYCSGGYVQRNSPGSESARVVHRRE